MTAWLTYIKERFPLPVYILLAGGISLSGFYVGASFFAPMPVLTSFIGVIVFFGVLRLMDEYKDYEKDKIVHPERPLPRGVLTPTQVSRVIKAFVIGMAGYGVVVGILGSAWAGILYIYLTIHLWFMFKEFYLGDWLAKRALWYANSHQAILLPVCAFGVVVTDSSLIREPSTWYFAFSVLGAFYCYEVCRKLDPRAHPLIRTYLSIYGTTKTFLIVFCALLVAAMGAWGLGAGKFLWPIEIVTELSFIIMFTKPSKYKIVEGMATLNLLIHLWAPAIRHWTGWP